MLIPELKKIKLQSEVVSIERHCHDEELTGIISSVNDDVITMHLYTDDGIHDRFTIFETDQITELFWGNREHQAIKHLISKTEPVITPKIENKEFQKIILEMNEKLESICLYADGDEDNFQIAKIVAFDDEWFKMHTFGIKKTLSRMHKIILRDIISRIVINSPYQDKIVALHATSL